MSLQPRLKHGTPAIRLGRFPLVVDRWRRARAAPAMAGAPPHSLLQLLRASAGNDTTRHISSDAFPPTPSPTLGLHRLIRPAVPTGGSGTAFLGGAQETDQEGQSLKTSENRLPLSLLIGTKVQESGKKLGEAFTWLWAKKTGSTAAPAHPTSKLKLALGAAKGIRNGTLSATKIEEDYLAHSLQEATTSRLKTLRAVLNELGSLEEERKWRCTPPLLKAVGSVLKAAGYKAAPLYMHDLKVKHVEEGHAWSDELDLTFKRIKRALERDAGPSRKAPEVKEGDLRRKPLAKRPVRGVSLAHELFLFAVAWMLRACELVQIKTDQVEFDHGLRTVSLSWGKTKGDQKASGTKRTLGCRCVNGNCDPLCPYHLCWVLISKLMDKHPRASHLVWSSSGRPKGKLYLVKAWKLIFGTKVGGHSARRTGALRYVRQGWAIPQVAYLGRWKSDVIYQYAEEALASMAVDPSHSPSFPAGTSAISPEEAEERGLRLPVTGPSPQEVLEAEVQRFKMDSAKVTKALSAEVKQMKESYDQHLSLPMHVKNMRSGLTHANVASTITTPSFAWRTVCGWRYHSGDYVFVRAEGPVSCAKCASLLDALQGGGVDWPNRRA